MYYACLTGSIPVPGTINQRKSIRINYAQSAVKTARCVYQSTQARGQHESHFEGALVRSYMNASIP